VAGVAQVRAELVQIKPETAAGIRLSRIPASCPDRHLGGGPGQTLFYFAATAVETVMLSPANVPVTVTFLPAC
jgi:hypothetical protein